MSRETRNFFALLLGGVAIVSLIYAAIMTRMIEKTNSRNFVLYATSPRTVVNSRGIPFSNYGYVNGVYVGLQANPLVIGEAAFSYSRDGLKARAQNCADWLLQHAIRHRGFDIIPYSYPWPQLYDIRPPWRSAMAQMAGARALDAVYRMTGKKKYAQGAEDFLRALFIEVSKGGVTYKGKDGWWFEEYATTGEMEPRVLNGMMYVLIQLHSFWIENKSAEAKFLFDRGIAALKADLPEYDGKGHSYYDRFSHYSRKYHRIHIQELNDLYEITRAEIFREYAVKWENDHF